MKGDRAGARAARWMIAGLALAVLAGCGGGGGLVPEGGDELDMSRIPQSSRKPAPLRGRYIVVLKDGVSPNAVARAHAVNPHQVYQSALNGFAVSAAEDRVEALRRDPRVAYVEPDLLMYAVGQSLPTGVNRIEADLNPTASINQIDERVDVDIAILDSGIDPNHPDLHVVQWANFIDSTNNDQYGHGTHVAGSAAAIDNGVGAVGVAPGARLWSVKVLNSAGNGTLSSILAGVNYVTQRAGQIEVANMSLGGFGYSSSLRQAIQNSVAQGVVYVVAAGNNRVDVFGNDRTFSTGDDFIPAAYPEVLTVSAMVDSDGRSGGQGVSTGYGPDDTIASFSNYSGSVAAGNPVTSPGRAIDLAAPGVNIYSTYRGGGYATMSGTSMAAPHIAGAVALWIADHGRANNASQVAAIRQAFIDGAQPQAQWGPVDTRDPDGGREGLIIAVWQSPGQPPNQAPVVAISQPSDGSSCPSGEAVMFGGTASDAEDGNLTSRLAWTSSRDGVIGSGGSFSTTLSEGVHTITASVTDSGGLAGDSVVAVTVESAPANTEPVVAISQPAGGEGFVSGTAIAFSGTASDAEDGDLTSRLAWTSSRDGAIGSGGSFSAILSEGVHTITASVTDSGGLAGSDAVQVTVVAPAPTVPLNVVATTDRAEYNHRDTVYITVRVSADGGPTANAAVEMVLTTPRGRGEVMTATTNASGVATFSHRVHTRRDGTGLAIVECTASRSGYLSGSATTSFTISDK